MDGEEEEVANIKCVPAMTLQLWESLLKPRGFEITGGKLARSPSKSQAQAGGDTDMSSPLHSKTLKSREKARESDRDAIGSVISSFKRVNSFAPVVKEKTAASASTLRQPFRRMPAVAEPGTSASGSQRPSMPAQDAASTKLFAGFKFRALGEARSANVRTEIEGCGGRMLMDDEADEDVDFIIVRLVRCAYRQLIFAHVRY